MVHKVLKKNHVMKHLEQAIHRRTMQTTGPWGQGTGRGKGSDCLLGVGFLLG